MKIIWDSTFSTYKRQDHLNNFVMAKSNKGQYNWIRCSIEEAQPTWNENEYMTSVRKKLHCKFGCLKNIFKKKENNIYD